MSSSVAAVIVTFNPDLVGLRTLLDALRPQVNAMVVVDNGSANAEDVATLAAQYRGNVLALEANLGIAAAQNRGMDMAMEAGASHLLLSDQDSVPAPDMVQQLVECLEAQSERGDRPIGAVGPVPLDERHGESDALVYSFTTWGPKRRSIPGAGEVLEVPFVLASGCLIPVEVVRAVGPMDEHLFIDHVDLAWCMTAGVEGYRILVCGDARLAHELGEDTVTLPGGRTVHVQSPFRNYYMTRNTLFLLRSSFMPFRWKVGYVGYLVKYVGFYTLVGFAEPRRWRAMARGLCHGLIGR